MTTIPKSIEFIDLQAQRKRLGERIGSAIDTVLNSGNFIMGPQVKAFEEQMAAFGQANYGLSCGNGTDAIALPLMGWGIGKGDAVFCPSFTFAATAEVIPWVNASPVFVDIDPQTYNMSAQHLEAAIEMVMVKGDLTPKAVIAVDLFGQPADYPAISAVARKYGLKLIADSAQGFGGTIDGKHPINWADAVTTSFFPAKPLGCYGDGGAVLTNDENLFDIMDSLRVHGKATKSDIASTTFEHDTKYLNVRIGMNSRLDTIQAAILIEKLAIFADEIASRNKVAARYNAALTPLVDTVPHVKDGFISTWAQYTIECPDRAKLGRYLKSLGIPSAVYYPVPIHKQNIYSNYPVGPNGLPVSEAKAEKVISLPMHPYLDTITQDRIIDAISSYKEGN